MFSGHSPAPPRCAMTSGRPASSAKYLCSGTTHPSSATAPRRPHSPPLRRRAKGPRAISISFSCSTGSLNFNRGDFVGDDEGGVRDGGDAVAGEDRVADHEEFGDVRPVRQRVRAETFGRLRRRRRPCRACAACARRRCAASPSRRPPRPRPAPAARRAGAPRQASSARASCSSCSVSSSWKENHCSASVKVETVAARLPAGARASHAGAAPSMRSALFGVERLALLPVVEREDVCPRGGGARPLRPGSRKSGTRPSRAGSSAARARPRACARRRRACRRCPRR